MAPEIALGNTRIDGRTDLYSLGCVAYWLLTGGLVFEENGATATILAHVQKAPVPPSTRSELKMSASLDQAVLNCLAKDPAQRPADAGALLRILDECDESKSWTPQDADAWWQTHMPKDVVEAEDHQDQPTQV
jgi:serine/threonine-protein kinase